MEEIKHTYDSENDVYVVPRDLMIKTIEDKETLLHMYKCILNTLDPKANMISHFTKQDDQNYTHNTELANKLYELLCLDDESEESDDE